MKNWHNTNKERGGEGGDGSGELGVGGWGGWGWVGGGVGKAYGAL